MLLPVVVPRKCSVTVPTWVAGWDLSTHGGQMNFHLVFSGEAFTTVWTGKSRRIVGMTLL